MVSGLIYTRVYDNLENSMWAHGVGGERLPAVSDALCSNKCVKMSIFCHRRGIEVFGCLFSINERPNKCIFFSDTLGWVGAPNERALFGVHDAVVGFVECLTRSRIAKVCEHRRICVIGVIVSLYESVLRDVLLASEARFVRDTLLFELIQALYCASLQCVNRRTRRHEEEPNVCLYF